MITFDARLKFAAVALGLAGAVLIGFAAEAKDQGPRGSTCEAHDKATSAWRDCIGRTAEASDHELFYAGYWLAKGGQYRDALDYLARIRSPDARALTYVGFATRKLGDVDAAMPFYRRALEIAPDFTVARAYLGEAHLAKGDMTAARSELAEIARRCGSHCAEHAELSAAIIATERARS